ncbi:MAG: 30S ribosomal protein S7, partial [Clostridia bacterium]|nr:30S ribosomal protein S7 [Clostridia bacterium]
MPRRGQVPKREVEPDPKYHSVKVAKLINQVMREGKKSLAQRICYGAFNLVEQRTGRNPLEVFEQALKNATPLLEVKARRVGGATYQVPVEVRPERRQTLAIRWLVTFARARSGKSMEEKLAAELLDAANGTGGAVKKREDTHRMAEANRA